MAATVIWLGRAGLLKVHVSPQPQWSVESGSLHLQDKLAS